MDIRALPQLDAGTFTPPAQAVKCGNRRDLPKAARRHDYRYAGTDTRHQFSGFFADCDVAICVTCGADIAQMVAPAA